MARLAIIKDSIVTNLILADDPADFPDYVDVTNTDCGIGWTDNGDGTYSPPLEPSGNIYTRLAKRSFMSRFTVAEWAAVKAAAPTDPVVDYFYEQFVLATYIDVTEPSLNDGLDYLIYINLLDPGRKAELLEPGTEAERYD
jgi:hypothetical protein